nr:hypothetical protein [Tanacetum cinerariifolium]
MFFDQPRPPDKWFLEIFMFSTIVVIRRGPMVYVLLLLFRDEIESGLDFLGKKRFKLVATCVVKCMEVVSIIEKIITQRMRELGRGGGNVCRVWEMWKKIWNQWLIKREIVKRIPTSSHRSSSWREKCVHPVLSLVFYVTVLVLSFRLPFQLGIELRGVAIHICTFLEGDQIDSGAMVSTSKD